MKVYKRNGSEQDFIADKIKQAIFKANKAVPEENQMSEELSEKVFQKVLTMLKGFNTITVDDINNIVERALMSYKESQVVAKAYILYRDDKKKNKKFNSIEEQALTIINGENTQLRGDNANKKIDLASGMRDYFAGLVCASIFNKTAPKSVIKAHKEGRIHFHDRDYSPAMPLFNCDLVNGKNMLEEGYQMVDTWIDPPKKFSTGANLLAQIDLIVGGSQYGGQTVSWAHLAPLVQKTREMFFNYFLEIYNNLPFIMKIFALPLKFKWVRKFFAEVATRNDVRIGVKTYQYQVICHQSQGQTPFVSNNLCLREAETEQEMEDLALIIEEILKRRIKGVKDSSKHRTGPLFPKLLYWECEGLNLDPTDPYYYLTVLAAKCNAIRCQPDINSEKKCREIKEGQIIPSMGCRSLLSPVWEEELFSLDTKFHWQYIDESNVLYKNAFRQNVNYSKELVYDVLPLNNLKNVAINFSGNTGWPLKVITMDSGEKFLVVKKPMVYGRFNSGVVTINTPWCAAKARQEVLNQETDKDMMTRFYEILDENLQTCREGLIYRTERVKKIKGKNIPIHLMHGAIARMGPEDTIEDWIKLHPKAMSTSFGFVGLYETCRLLINESNTTDNGRKLCKEVLTHINEFIDKCKEEDHLNYSLYGTPEESTTSKFADALRRDFGLIEYVTDKDYVVNSYHVDPREEIDAFRKLAIEGEYLELCPGGAVSYVEVPNLEHNIKAILNTMRYMYDTILYAEFNRLMGHCYTCGFSGVIPLTKSEDGKFIFTCPHCGETDDAHMRVDGRVCGYLGQLNQGNANKGRLDDVFHRVIHYGLYLINAIGKAMGAL